MPEIKAILNDCFEALSKEYSIELVDYIPEGCTQKKVKVPVWKVTVIAEVFRKVSEVEAYIAFPNEFPFLLPYVVIPEERFSLLPHISVKSRKLCLFEDGVVYDTTNVYGIIKECICKVRKWLELYSNQDNTSEYAKELDSYWTEQYEGESSIEPHWILLGRIPDKSCELQGYLYPVDFLGKDNDYFEQCIVCGADVSTDILNNIKIRHKVNKIPVLFVKSMRIPDMPPYSITGLQFFDCIENGDDKKQCVRFLNNNLKGHFLFPLGLDYMLGGVCVPKQNVNKKGFRVGSLNAKDILTEFENKNKKLNRIKAGIYDEMRMANRTAGQLMPHRNFFVAGLGSIGSNLCYYLNGYNNANFTLVDPDNLTVDNIGRHLLGFSYIDQRKAYAVADYFTQYRPDRKVKPEDKSIESIPIAQFNEVSAIFICTGDVMSELWLLDKLRNKEILKPSFLLWLEPYGISGIMVYINPDDDRSINILKSEATKCFTKYCLIDDSEYKEGNKLIQHDAGCNGKYAQYSANDVTLFLSAMFPQIDRLLDKKDNTQFFQWVGNLEIARQKGIRLAEKADGLSKGQVQVLNV